eukprot:Phypoly_transcript_10755.p1 GENE.Phypoly_transcript_10755~~Phypoly_transcript_10755.p1  ORF type:complete len:406 (+),score=59.06 Phypoly_transcript_10755:45-1262(+)
MLKTGILSKQSKTLKLWETRGFVLRNNSLDCYKNQSLQNPILESIILDHEVVLSLSAKKKNVFTIFRNGQKWVLRAHSGGEMDEWTQAINEIIRPKDLNSRTAFAKSILSRLPECCSFLLDKGTKVRSYWEVWFEHLPELDEKVDVRIATSASMEKLALRLRGPQVAVVQKFVDFFWFAGSPETEIDRLGDIGAFLNIPTMGLNAEISEKGGMDGGWFFVDEIAMERAMEVSDFGHPGRTVLAWAEKNKITHCFSVGRDMGLPPRQTEIRVSLKGDFLAQVYAAIDSFSFFGFPSVPFLVREVIERSEPENLENDPLCLSIIFNSMGFVQLGIHIPNPSPETVSALCSFAPEAIDDSLGTRRAKLEQMVGNPVVAEYSCLAEGYGYGVYHEGFDVMLHYKVGPPL